MTKVFKEICPYVFAFEFVLEDKFVRMLFAFEFVQKDALGAQFSSYVAFHVRMTSTMIVLLNMQFADLWTTCLGIACKRKGMGQIGIRVVFLLNAIRFFYR